MNKTLHLVFVVAIIALFLGTSLVSEAQSLRLKCERGAHPCDTDGDGRPDNCCDPLIRIKCEQGSHPCDTDGDGQPDNCCDPLIHIKCEEGMHPCDLNGDGRPDSCCLPN